MAEQYAISAANLNAIEKNLNSIHRDLEAVNSDVSTVNSNVKIVYDQIGSLARDFHDFVTSQLMANEKANSQQKLVQIRMEMEKRFGHYDIVRRTTTGILQADDLGIVKKETISDATEELMISTPGYWLAPCLVALAAWINDQPELAERALREGLRRNDEKTSLFFALVCRRADRKASALKWTQRYLANQDEENLSRNTVIILDAFASGLLGADSEGVISKQMDEWMARLADKPGFVEQQTNQWSDAINLKRKSISSSDYPYLRKYSKTWPKLEKIMEGANLHADILDYFTNIFEQECSTDALKEQLDDILNSLVTDFDDEELPLRKEEKYHEFVVQFNGDTKRAQQNMSVEQTALEEKKDFTQLLTDAAMKPTSSHSSVSTQKFAIALSKDWIVNAYNDVVACNRSNIPAEVKINVDTFNDTTIDGHNEDDLVRRFHAKIEQEQAEALKQCELSPFERYSLYAGAAIGLIGIIMLIAGSAFLGIIAMIAGIGLVLHHFSKKKQIEASRQTIVAQFDEKRIKGTQIIRATVAEVVDFQSEFAQKDADSQKVLDFLEALSPDQYVKKLADSNRRIMVSK